MTKQSHTPTREWPKFRWIVDRKDKVAQRVCLLEDSKVYEDQRFVIVDADDAFDAICQAITGSAAATFGFLAGVDQSKGKL